LFRLKVVKLAFAPPSRTRYPRTVADSRWPFEPDPVIEVYKRDIDRTLIRENLKRSVEERLDNLIALQRFSEELQRARRATRRP
jgi:hypothetical protein